MGKNGRKSCRRWLLPAALVLAGAAWFENFTLSSSTVEVRSAALPATAAGIEVIEHLAEEGIPICATINVSVSQAIAVAEAYARGKQKALAAGV